MHDDLTKHKCGADYLDDTLGNFIIFVQSVC